mmetsp:Transcript_9449/g.29362  ORF Transcript_9449/g.29362 Transcript_9449/m.29362 type:complete len:465 (-) Transcript_9449:785-2179(-)
MRLPREMAAWTWNQASSNTLTSDDAAAQPSWTHTILDPCSNASKGPAMKPSTSASSPLFKPHKAQTSSDVSLLTKLRTHNADLASLIASRDGRFGLATWGQLSSSSSSDSDNNPVSLAIRLASARPDSRAPAAVARCSLEVCSPAHLRTPPQHGAANASTSSGMHPGAKKEYDPRARRSSRHAVAVALNTFHSFFSSDEAPSNFLNASKHFSTTFDGAFRTASPPVVKPASTSNLSALSAGHKATSTCSLVTPSRSTQRKNSPPYSDTSSTRPRLPILFSDPFQYSAFLQKGLSNFRATLSKTPKPSLAIACVFQFGKGGSKANPRFNTPNGTVTTTTSATSVSVEFSLVTTIKLFTRSIFATGHCNLTSRKGRAKPAHNAPRPSRTAQCAPSYACSSSWSQNRSDNESMGQALAYSMFARCHWTNFNVSVDRDCASSSEETAGPRAWSTPCLGMARALTWPSC